MTWLLVDGRRNPPLPRAWELLVRSVLAILQLGGQHDLVVVNDPAIAA